MESISCLETKKDSVKILENRWNLKKKFSTLDSPMARELFALHESSPLAVFEDKSFDEILSMTISQEHLKIGLLLEILLNTLKQNHISFCDFDCQSCEKPEQKNTKCKFLSLRLRYTLCLKNHAVHLECDSSHLKECPICGSDEVLKAFKVASHQTLAILDYMVQRRKNIQSEFDETCEFKAKSFVEAAKIMHKKNSTATANDSALEEVFSLISLPEELLTMLLQQLKYDLFDLESLEVVSTLDNFSFTTQQITHLNTLRKQFPLSVGIQNEQWKALPSSKRMKAFKMHAKSLCPKALVHRQKHTPTSAQ